MKNLIFVIKLWYLMSQCIPGFMCMRGGCSGCYLSVNVQRWLHKLAALLLLLPDEMRCLNWSRRGTVISPVWSKWAWFELKLQHIKVTFSWSLQKTFNSWDLNHVKTCSNAKWSVQLQLTQILALELQRLQTVSAHSAWICPTVLCLKAARWQQNQENFNAQAITWHNHVFCNSWT